MKRIISILIITIIMLSSTAAAYADVVNSERNGVIEINLEGALAQAEKANPDILLLDKKIALYQKKYVQALDARDKAKDKWSPNESENLTYRKDEELNWVISQNDLEGLKLDKLQKVNELKTNIKKQYMDILMLQADIADINDEVKNMDSQIKQSEAKLKLGQIKEADLNKLKSQRIQLVSQYNSTNRQIDIAMISFKKDLGIDMSKKLSLKQELIGIQVLDESNIGDLIKKAVENSSDLVKAVKELEAVKLERKVTFEHTNWVKSNQVSNLDTEIGEKEAALDTLKLQIEASLWTEYYNVKILEDALNIEQLNFDIEKLNYTSVEARVKVGQLDSVSDMNARLALNKQENNLKRAMNNYYIELEKFKLDLNQQ